MKAILTGVRKSYGKRVVLNIENLAFDEGKIYAILGPNGSGKTTMLKIIAGIEHPDTGSIQNETNDNLFKDISYMPQRPYLFHMTVIKNISIGLKKIPDMHTISMEALSKVGMEGFAFYKAKSLSGGEAQRVALARTMVLHKKLVLLDEPSSSSDISSTELIESYIRNVCTKDRSTIIFSTHNPSQASRLADYVVFLCNGVVAEYGPAKDVLHEPKSAAVKKFLENWKI